MPFNILVSTVPEHLQMELIDIQCETELKPVYTATEKNNFYNAHITVGKYSNLRNLTKNCLRIGVYVCVRIMFYINEI